MLLSQYAKSLRKSIRGLWRLEIIDRFIGVDGGAIIAYTNLDRVPIPLSSTPVDDITEKDVRIGFWRRLQLADLKQMVVGKPIFAISERKYGTIVGMFRDPTSYDGRFPVRMRVPNRQQGNPRDYSFEACSVEDTEVLCLSNERVVTFDLFESSDACEDLEKIGLGNFTVSQYSNS